jgi:hypothetical protein
VWLTALADPPRRLVPSPGPNDIREQSRGGEQDQMTSIDRQNKHLTCMRDGGFLVVTAAGADMRRPVLLAS